MKQIDLSIVDDAFLESYYKSINVVNIKSKLSDPRYKLIIDNLEDIIKTKDLRNYLKLGNYCYSIEEKKEILDAFDYKNHRQKKPIFMGHFKKLNIKSCPFCNNNYIYFYDENENKKFNTLATLEHYYPKADYPHLSLSFYNLIPSCSVCNSKFKGKKELEGKIAHPYFDDFDNNAEFLVRVDSLGIKKDIDLGIQMKSYNKKCDASIKRFQLDKIYRQHSDIAKEIWNKAQLYNESRIEELHKEFYAKLGYTKEDVKNMLFCNYLDRNDINRRNHSKLTQDILKQWGLKHDKN